MSVKGEGGVPPKSVTFFGENFVQKGGGGTPLTDKIRKVVFDPFPWTKNKCFLGKNTIFSTLLRTFFGRMSVNASAYTVASTYIVASTCTAASTYILAVLPPLQQSTMEQASMQTTVSEDDHKCSGTTKVRNSGLGEDQYHNAKIVWKRSEFWP